MGVCVCAVAANFPTLCPQGGCLDDLTPVFDLLFGESKGSSYLMNMVRHKYAKYPF